MPGDILFSLSQNRFSIKEPIPFCILCKGVSILKYIHSVMVGHTVHISVSEGNLKRDKEGREEDQPRGLSLLGKEHKGINEKRH